MEEGFVDDALGSAELEDGGALVSAADPDDAGGIDAVEVADRVPDAVAAVISAVVSSEPETVSDRELVTVTNGSAGDVSDADVEVSAPGSSVAAVVGIATGDVEPPYAHPSPRGMDGP